MLPYLKVNMKPLLIGTVAGLLLFGILFGLRSIYWHARWWDEELYRQNVVITQHNKVLTDVVAYLNKQIEDQKPPMPTMVKP